MALPPSVTLCECWPRDGLQSVPKVVATRHKIEMINRIVDAGVRKLEVTSFSHPRYLPQFADSEEVLRRIERRPGVSYVVLIPNMKGFQRFAECQHRGYGADEIVLMISASEHHNRVNFHMGHDEAKRSHAEIIEAAKRLGIKVIGCAGTVYGCPIGGDVAMDDVIDITAFYINSGADTVMLGDTTGAGNPVSVRRRIGRLQDLFPGTDFIAHFHDTRGNGIVNSFVALEMGLRYVDTSLGAIGGQPCPDGNTDKYQAGYTGNTCTEDLVALLAEMGVHTGIDVGSVMEAGLRAEEILGMRTRANTIRCGPVNHAPRERVLA